MRYLEFYPPDFNILFESETTRVIDRIITNDSGNWITMDTGPAESRKDCIVDPRSERNQRVLVTSKDDLVPVMLTSRVMGFMPRIQEKVLTTTSKTLPIMNLKPSFETTASKLVTAASGENADSYTKYASGVFASVNSRVHRVNLGNDTFGYLLNNDDGLVTLGRFHGSEDKSTSTRYEHVVLQTLREMGCTWTERPDVCNFITVAVHDTYGVYSLNLGLLVLFATLLEFGK